MSNLFNTHAVVSYTSGKTKPLEGQRLAKVTYKVDKATGIKPESKAVSIPVLKWTEIEAVLPAIKDAVVAMVHTAQDKLIRELVEAGAVEVRQEQITLQAVVASMLEDSGRLTGETIREWFTDSLKEPLMLAFASKLGIGEVPTSEQEKKLDAILKGYEDSFAKLASGAASFNDTQKANMLKALDLLDTSEDVLASKFVARLSKKSEDELLMSL